MNSGVNPGGYQQNSSFQSLLDTLDTGNEDDQKLKQAIEQAQGNNASRQQDAWQVLNEKLPPIDTFA